MHTDEQHKLQLLFPEHHKLKKYYLFTSSTSSYLLIYFCLQKNSYSQAANLSIHIIKQHEKQTYIREHHQFQKYQLFTSSTKS